MTLPRGGAADLRARIEAPHDALRVDNEAFGWIAGVAPLAVTVVGKQTRMAGADRSPRHPRSARDVRRARRLSAGQRRRRHLRSLGAAGAAGQAGAVHRAAGRRHGSDRAPTGVEQKPQWTTAAAHPVLDGVDPFTFSIERAHVYQPPQLHADRAIGRGHAARLGRRDAPAGRASVVLAFGPADSNLASAPAFPVLMGNALDWLARPAA